MRSRFLVVLLALAPLLALVPLPPGSSPYPLTRGAWGLSRARACARSTGTQCTWQAGWRKCGTPAWTRRTCTVPRVGRNRAATEVNRRLLGDRGGTSGGRREAARPLRATAGYVPVERPSGTEASSTRRGRDREPLGALQGESR